MRNTGVVVVAVLALLGCATTPPASQPGRAAVHQGTQSPRPAARHELRAGGSAWVSVSVATVWRSPRSPRPVDSPALQNPVAMVRWLSGMSLDQRRDLSGRADTQALMGDRVRVLGVRAGWVRVAVPGQPSPLDARGYPGWVPRRQLTARPPTVTPSWATVTRRTAWLRTDAAEGRRRVRVSYGTRLPVVGRTARELRVATPDGTVLRVAAGDVVEHPRSRPALAPSSASLVSAATSFVGLAYLWSGASGFGVDCSGLTWLVYRVHGIRIPRDASPQSEAGTPVRFLRRGDLLFYADGGLVHHVTMYVGGGRMVHAPGTGDLVRVDTTASLGPQYAGARRFLP
jgi:cell wall-associated NlpC family hydrolase|nr:C40 family peptidase [Nocardioides agariphilus]